jgi:hypothetical protein
MENPASQPITAPPNTVTFYDIANSQTISDADLQTTPSPSVTYTLSCDASKDALYIIPYRAEAVYTDDDGNYYQLQVAEMFIYNITTGKFSSEVLAGEELNAGTTEQELLLGYPAATSVEEGLGVLAFQYYNGTNYYAYINTTKVSTKGPTAVTNALSSKLTTIEAVGFPEAVVVKFSDGSNDYYALVKSDGTVSTSPQINGFTTADELVAYKNNYYIRSGTSLYAVTLDLTNNAVTFTKIATVYSDETFNFTLPGMGLDGIAGVSATEIAPIYSISGDISSFVPIQVVIANATNVAAPPSYMPSENSFALYYTNSTDNNNLYVAFMKISGANMVKGTSTTTTIKQEYITTVTTTQVPFPLILAPFGYFLRKRKKE